MININLDYFIYALFFTTLYFYFTREQPKLIFFEKQN